jgi:ubiquitin-like modifier-activating enzyme ATG7
MTDTLQFNPFSSSIDVAYWHAFTEKKLDVFKLSDASVEINGAYCVGFNEAVPPRLIVEAKAFEPRATFVPPNRYYAVGGTLKNFNTIEEFQNSDKKTLFGASATQVIQVCLS